MKIEELKSNLSNDGISINIDDININHKFRLKINCDYMDFEVFFMPSEVKKLYVCLTAVAQDIKKYPVFHRATWACSMDGAFLCIDDPTREIIKHEISTYYYGNNNYNCVDSIVKIVKKICNIYNIDVKNVYFVSNSNGGFGAISCCDLFTGSNCIVFNPNVNMPLWQSGKNTNEITHDILFQKIFNVDFNDNKYYNRFYLDRIINNNFSNFFIYYNIASINDKLQLDWLCSKIKINYNIGINKINNIFLYVVNIDSKQPNPHHIFPNESSFPIIEDIIKNGIDKIKKDSLNMLCNYMKLFYSAQNEIAELKSHISRYNNLNKNNKEIIKEDINSFVGNKIIVVNEDGKEELVQEFPKLKVRFLGKNSLVRIYKPIYIYENLTIDVGEQGFVEIYPHARITKLYIRASAFMSKCIIKNNCSVIDAVISMIDEERLNVIIGEHCMLSKNVMIRTSDGHAIIDLDSNNVINKAEYGIYIDNHVWIGLNVTILKDVKIPFGCVIGSGSLVTKREYKSNSIIAGVPAKVIKENIKWDPKRPDRY